MTETTSGSEGDFDPNEPMTDRLEELEERVELLRTQKHEMEDKILNISAEKNKVEQRLEKLRRENQKLKQSPLYVASVEDLTDQGVVIRQHGNNQEALTEVTGELREELEPGDRVSINKQLAIVEKLDADADMRAQAMEMDVSPDVTYDDIGGIADQIEEVRETIEMPLEDPEVFENIGISPPSGVLLHGPPGTGKTMLAKAVANQTDATFIKMAGSELVQKFIGEGSKLVRDIFEIAEENEPAVLFIDEIDAIATKRTDPKTSGESEVNRTLMQLLTEMDGFDDRGDVRIIGATNRFDMLDDAILRPGRFDRIIEVPTPDAAGRAQIFDIHTEGMSIDDDIDFEHLTSITEEASGADIKAICTEAGMFAIRNGRETVEMSDFLDAVDKILDEDADEEMSPGIARSFA